MRGSLLSSPKNRGEVQRRLEWKESRMTVWRPSQQIRVKVIGLAWREDRLLAAEV